MNAVEEHDEYFVQKRNAAGTLGLSCLQKVVAAFRLLAYGVAADALDEYIRIGESTALEALRKFAVAVVEIFGQEYMRLPNEEDTARLQAIGANRGFPGMLGSIDCMHWSWKNYPTAWHGMYRGHKKSQQLYLKQLLLKISGYGIHSLVCLVHTMISMCFKDLLYLQGLLREKVHKLISTSMAMIILWVIILQMAYICHGPLL